MPPHKQPSNRPHPALPSLLSAAVLAATVQPSAAQTDAARALPWPSLSIADGILLAGGLLGVGLVAVTGLIAVLALVSLHRSRQALQAEGEAGRAALRSVAGVATDALRASQESAVEALRSDLRSGRDLLDRRADELVLTIQGRSRAEAKILAESLAGELGAIESALETHLIRLDAFLTERAEAGYSKVGLRDLLPRVGSPVFAAQAGRLGLVGGSLAGDLAWVYGNFQAWENLESAASTRQSTVPLDEAQQAMEAIEDVREGALHLIGRLHAFIDDRPAEMAARTLVHERVAARREALFMDEDGNDNDRDDDRDNDMDGGTDIDTATDGLEKTPPPDPEPEMSGQTQAYDDSVRVTPLRPEK